MRPGKLCQTLNNLPERTMKSEMSEKGTHIDVKLTLTLDLILTGEK